MPVKKRQEKKNQCLQNTEVFLECVFMFLLGVADRSKFASAVVIHMRAWKNMFYHTWLVLVTEHLTCVSLLNPQSINCPML